MFSMRGFLRGAGLAIAGTAALVLFPARSRAELVTVIDESWSAPTTGWTYNGSAAEADGWLRLTTAEPNLTGSAFYNASFPSSYFVAEFDFELGGGTGADGITFTVQPLTPAALGGAGHNLGYGNRPLVLGATHVISPSLAVEFDTYDNSSYPGWPETENHIGVDLDAEMNSVLLSSAIPELEDAGVFRARVEFDAPHIRVLLGPAGGAAMTTVIDADVPGYVGFGDAYFGFTGGTGDYSNLQRVDNFVVMIPEPGALLLLALGAAVAARRRRSA